jgi:hypothetical protein
MVGHPASCEILGSGPRNLLASFGLQCLLLKSLAAITWHGLMEVVPEYERIMLLDRTHPITV